MTTIDTSSRDSCTTTIDVHFAAVGPWTPIAVARRDHELTPSPYFPIWWRGEDGPGACAIARA